MATSLTTLGVFVGTPAVTAKAWAYYRTTSTAAILGAYGFGGITDRGTGYVSLEFSVTQPDLFWSATGMTGSNGRLTQDGQATSTTAVHLFSITGGSASTNKDISRNYCTVHGS